MTTLITGATGFVGSHLLSRLASPVHVLSRDPQRAARQLAQHDIRAFGWEPREGAPPAEAFAGVDAVIHLAGESIADGRWTAEKKRSLRESRVLGTRHLVDALESLDSRPRCLISASAVGIYGDHGDEVIDETTDPASGFLAELCIEWESEARRAEDLGVRVVNPRLGIVLGRNGGALGKMLTPFKLGIGGVLGSGSQWMPWIHIDDVCGLLQHAISSDDLHGPLNATSPLPVTNREFTKTIGRVLHRPTVLPVPAFALHLALGEFANVLLESQRVLPERAEESGYQFQFSDLEAALTNLLQSQSVSQAA